MPSQPAVSKTLGEIWGERVAVRRQALGLSQAQLAELCDVNQQTISKTETGETLPREKLKFALAAHLEVGMSILFAYPEGAQLKAAS